MMGGASMSIGLNDVVEVLIRGTNSGGRAYSNTIHYLVAALGSGVTLTTEEVGTRFRDLFRDGSGATLGLKSYTHNATALDPLLVRRVIGLGPAPPQVGNFEYDEPAEVPLQFQPGYGGEPMPNGVAIRIEKLTGELERYWQGRIHLGAIPEDIVGPDGNTVIPATRTLMDLAAALLRVLTSPLGGATWTAAMVILSRTHWARFGGPISQHHKLVTAFLTRAITGTIRKRTPPFP
jgi:hypothetical protein